MSSRETKNTRRAGNFGEEQHDGREVEQAVTGSNADIITDALRSRHAHIVAVMDANMES